MVKDFGGDDESLAPSISVNPTAVYDDGIGGTGGGRNVACGGTFNLAGVEFSLSDVAPEFQFQSRLKSRLLTCNLGSRGGGEEEDRGRGKYGILYMCVVSAPKQYKKGNNVEPAGTVA